MSPSRSWRTFARRARDQADSGQAAVEVALVLPLVAGLLLTLVQVGIIVRAQVLVTHAAREGARAAAVDAAPGAGPAAAAASSSLDPDRLDVSVSGGGATGSQVLVRVDYDLPTDLPLVGGLLGDVELSAQAVMRVE